MPKKSWTKKLLAAKDDGAWRAFHEEICGRLIFFIARAQGVSFSEAAARVDEVLGEAFSVTVPLLSDNDGRDAIVDGDGGFERFFFGVVRNLCRRRSRGPVEVESGVFKTSSTPSKGVMREEANKNARRFLRRLIQSLRRGVVEQLKRNRTSNVSAAARHWTLLDLEANERLTQNKDRAALFDIEPPDATKLRRKVLERVARAFAVVDTELWTAGGGRLESAEILQSDAFRLVWVEEIACPAPLLRDINCHPSHRKDVELFVRSHLEVVRCPMCAPADRGEMDKLKQSLADSFLRSASESIGGFSSSSWHEDSSAAR